MAAQVAQPPQQPWFAASSPTYPPRMSILPPTNSLAAQRDLVRASMAQQEGMSEEQDGWGGEYVGFRFKKPDDPTAPQQQQQHQREAGESSGASTPESGGSSSGWSSGAGASGAAGGMPAQKGNRKALSKSRLSYHPTGLGADFFRNVQENYRGKRGLLLGYYPPTGFCRK